MSKTTILLLCSFCSWGQLLEFHQNNNKQKSIERSLLHDELRDLRKVPPTRSGCMKIRQALDRPTSNQVFFGSISKFFPKHHLPISNDNLQVRWCLRRKNPMTPVSTRVSEMMWGATIMWRCAEAGRSWLGEDRETVGSCKFSPH